MDTKVLKEQCQIRIKSIYDDYKNSDIKDYVKFYEVRNKIHGALFSALEIYAENNADLEELISWVSGFDKEFVRNHGNDINKNSHLITK